jgi:hypothetical protein
MNIFFIAGYVVSKGLAPYGVFPAKAIFNHPGFLEEIPGIGYPPFWTLFLGLSYLFVYGPTENIFAYNLAIKLPSILSNIVLAFVLEKIAVHEGANKETSNKIFYFFLFNPFMIYISAAWGQFDSLVILITILAMNDLFRGRTKRSALLLAMSTSLKIIPFILTPLFMLFNKRNRTLKSNLQFILALSVALIAFSYAPFILFNWDLDQILDNPSYHFQRAGCLSFFNILELILRETRLPQEWQFFGYLWIPALALGYSFLSKTSLRTQTDMFRWASSLLFILMLTRTWVSEQNVILLIPPIMLYEVVILRKWMTVQSAWIITIVFTVLNATPFQMFFLLSPEPGNIVKAFDQIYLDYRLVAKFVIVIPWNILGWYYVMRTIKATGRDARTQSSTRNHEFVDVEDYSKNESDSPKNRSDSHVQNYLSRMPEQKTNPHYRCQTAYDGVNPYNERAKIVESLDKKTKVD